MALPPGLAVSVLKAIFQEVHVQVSDNSHLGIFYIAALDITRIRWQKEKNLPSESSELFQAFDHICMLSFASCIRRGRHAITSDLCPLTPKESETHRRQVLVIGSIARLLGHSHTFSLRFL